MGDNGAAAILNNSATLLVYGGFKDADDLAAFSTLAGERDEPVATYDPQNTLTGITHRRVPVLSPAQISQLPTRRVLIIRRGMAPAVGRVQMAWKRHDVRATNRRLHRAAQVERLTAAYRGLAAWASEWADDLSEEVPARIRPYLRSIARGLSGQLPARSVPSLTKEPSTDA